MGDSEQTPSPLAPTGEAPPEAPVPAASATSDPCLPPAPKKSRLWLWIILGIVAALVIAAIVLTGVVFGGGSEVPDLAGLSIDQATAVLEDEGLVLGRIVYTVELPEGTKEGEIVGQLPAAGTQAEKGTLVDVVVARGEQGVAVPNLVGMTSDEATETLEQAGLMAESVEVQADAEVGVVVDQSPDAGVMVGPGSAVTLMISARAAETLVPNVIGKTQDEATAVLDGAGYVVEASTVYDDKVEDGLVVDQSPSGGNAAEPGSTVTILVSMGKNPEAKVPDVVGKSEADAAQALSDAGFETVSSPSFSETVPVGNVISQDPEAGSSASAGSPVSISVSQGPKPAETTTVPDVVGKNEGEATDLLEQAGYQVTAVRAFSDTVARDLVAAQAPMAGNVTPLGITVALLVSDGPRPDTEFVTVPDVRGMSLDEATATLEKAGLKVTSFEFFTQLAPEGAVFAQLPPPEYPVAPGSAVLVIVSKGPYLQVNPL